MPAVHRLGDISQGHCFEPRAIVTASENVFANGKGVTRVGDYSPVHTCGDSSHDSVMAQGSPTVFVNGIPMCRIGDLHSCGDKAGTGSPNVFSN